MDILKSAIDWARGEVFSTSFFILFGVVFLFASVGFWYLGKTEIARAYIMPTLVAGAMLLIIGFGLFFNNVVRIKQFEKAHKADAPAFVDAELERADATLKEYKNVVFTAIPIIVAVCAIALLFANTPVLRASIITAIAFLVILLLVDGTAHGRVDEYNKQLIEAKNK